MHLRRNKISKQKSLAASEKRYIRHGKCKRYFFLKSKKKKNQIERRWNNVLWTKQEPSRSSLDENNRKSISIRNTTGAI